MNDDIWFVPFEPDFGLIYAPFHGVSTLVNRSMTEAVCRCLEDETRPVPEEIEWVRELRGPGKRPGRHRGVPDPVFLGLIPTRSCMMQCAYCDFATLQKHPVMSFDLIRQAVDGYAGLLRGKQDAEWNMHFFGGEPFAAYKEVVFALIYARRKAAELNIPTHFEVTTNGFYSEEKSRWIAENFDTVVLSLDGFPETQNLHRPGPGNCESFHTVCRSADIFSRGSCELIIRSCVSAENVEKLPEWAAFIAERWIPESVCLEPMIESPLARKNGLHPPDAGVFARNWALARKLLKTRRIRLVYSSGEIHSLNNSLCPMGRDAMIVDPDGLIGSCWQLPENQQIDEDRLHFGSVTQNSFQIDPEKFEKLRCQTEKNRESCRGCFCYAHCAGGCMLSGKRDGDFCRLTRLLTLWQIMEELDYFNYEDQTLLSGSFRNWIGTKKEFRLSRSDFSDIPEGLEPWGPVLTEPEISTDFRELSLPDLPADVGRGWVRNGSKTIFADVDKDFVKVMDGDESLRFQLENSGMNDPDIEMVWRELRKGVD